MNRRGFFKSVASIIMGLFVCGKESKSNTIKFQGVDCEYERDLQEVKDEWEETAWAKLNGGHPSGQPWDNNCPIQPVWGECNCIDETGFHHYCFNIKRV